MSRILSIDYGRKRCGIAVTDSLQISANGLPTVPTHNLMEFLKQYCSREEVELIIIGEPRQMDGTPSESSKYIEPFIRSLKKEMPNMKISRWDERFTSVIAHRELLAGGFKKSQRREKGRADEMSAVLILTDYLNSR